MFYYYYYYYYDYEYDYDYDYDYYYLILKKCLSQTISSSKVIKKSWVMQLLIYIKTFLKPIRFVIPEPCFKVWPLLFLSALL